MDNEPFEDYLIQEVTSTSEPPENEPEIDDEKYDIAKPKRVVIRGQIINDKD